MSPLLLSLVALVGSDAPPFSTVDWITAPPEIEGKVVLVRFWVGQCPFCEKSAPALNALHTELVDQGLVVIGIHHPKSDESGNLDYVRAHAKTLGFEFAIGHDQDWSTVKAFGVGTYFKRYTSVSVLFDQWGVIRWVHDGGTFDAAAAESARSVIRRLLATKTEEVTLDVRDWVCGACATKTMKALRKADGVKRVTVHEKEKRVVVTYDSSLTTPGKLVGVVTTLGYRAQAR